jgi:hypothetical protein
MNSDQRGLGRFRLDLGRRELVYDEKPVRLGSRALDILVRPGFGGGRSRF